MTSLREEPRTVVVVAGGDPPDPRTGALVAPGTLVIAADSGADHALALGLHVDLLIGDLDSISTDARARVIDAGGVVEEHPVAKDATDLELALERALGHGADRIVVIGGHGGRSDHHLAGLLLLAAPWMAPAVVTAWHDSTLLTVVRAADHVILRGEAGSMVSLVPVDGAAIGVTTGALAFSLADEDLSFGTTRGVSNVLRDKVASVTLRAGVLLVVQPDALAHHLPGATPGPPTDVDPEEPR